MELTPAQESALERIRAVYPNEEKFFGKSFSPTIHSNTLEALYRKGFLNREFESKTEHYRSRGSGWAAKRVRTAYYRFKE